MKIDTKSPNFDCLLDSGYYSFYIGPRICDKNSTQCIKIQYIMYVYEKTNISKNHICDWIITVSTLYTVDKNVINSITYKDIEIRDKETNEQIYVDKVLMYYLVKAFNKRLTYIHVDKLYC